MTDSPAIPDRASIRRLESLSPFELRERLLALGSDEQRRVAKPLLNAGRGNPDFLTAAPREAFFQLGLFAVHDARAAGQWSAELVAQPPASGIAGRLDDWLTARDGEPGIAFLRQVVAWITAQGWNVDDVVYEFVDGVLGAHYPDPPAMLTHCATIAARYLGSIMGDGFPDAADLDVFATEGGTAAMRYSFDTLFINALLRPGDKVAIMTPVFTPYLDIAALPGFDLEVVQIAADATFADGTHSWQFSAQQLDKLRDPSIKALVCINPTNPPSVRLDDAAVERIADVVREDNPGLIVITDDVYGTFVEGFRSLSAVVPRNTILVYSFSKYFGATGWRLGVITTTRDTVLDDALRALPDTEKERLQQRYSSLTEDAASLTFAQRLVADSRDVALNHTAGLSQPQQVQLALFALFDLLDTERTYRAAAQALIARRLDALLDGLGITLDPDPLRAGYYIELDFMAYAEAHYDAGFAAFLRTNYEPTDILFRLAAQTEIVALNGSGFDGPPWSIRLSLANLDENDYRAIGIGIRHVAEEYLAEWKANAPRP
ncbi:bifunctional aspartate transaminase/aspartate 4-decarboxylase [Microbacterium koreense]|uniref:Aminotransferase n=1 Tax=Microbacterium koreense TaxID=323761 RepID=A0ABW2ZMY5_9MICO